MMCLSIIDKGEIKKKALVKLSDSGYYWKVVAVFDRLYYPLFQRKNTSFDTGNNETKPRYDGLGYKVGFHLYCDKRDAEKTSFYGFSRKIIRCIVKKKDIVAIGFNCLSNDGKTIVTSRFWMPKPN